MRATTESQLVRACLALLRIRGVFAWRQNQGAIPCKGGYRRFNGLAGVADILAVVPTFPAMGSGLAVGRLVGVECKIAAGRQTPAQREFQRRLEDAGGAYLVVRDVRELEAWLAEAMA
jgi:hypothetical protein